MGRLVTPRRIARARSCEIYIDINNIYPTPISGIYAYDDMPPLIRHHFCPSPSPHLPPLHPTTTPNTPSTLIYAHPPPRSLLSTP